MKFKIKQFKLGDEPGKFSTDEVDANTPQELEAMMKIMGYRIEIIESSGTPNITHLLPPIMNTQVPPPPPPPPPVSKEFFFSDNGIEYKILDGKVFKKDWIELCYKQEYRIVNEENRVIKSELNSTLKVQVKDWIEVKK